MARTRSFGNDPYRDGVDEYPDDWVVGEEDWLPVGYVGAGCWVWTEAMAKCCHLVQAA